MAIRNLRAISNRYVSGSVNPNLIGTWLSSQGYAQVGDAEITGSITGSILTVSAITSGALAVGSLLSDTTFSLAPATAVTAFGSGHGGMGTYTVEPSQTVASEAMSANGPGARTSGYTTFSGLPMQVQAVSAQDLRHLDGLNISETNRVVYMNFIVQGVQRPDVKGGDILQIPTGLTSAPYDTWLVKGCLENWDQGNWSKILVVLQMPTVSQ